MNIPVFGAALLALAWGTTAAQTAAPVRPATVDLIATHSNLSSGLPQGEAVNLRGVWRFERGDTLQVEALDERRFGLHGGILGAAYTRVLSPDWYATGTAALGHGGPNWATWRVDAQLSRKWLAQRQLVTSAAFYYARFKSDGSDAFARHEVDSVVYDTPTNPISLYRVVFKDRSDRGLRLSAAWYLPLPAVLEAGVTFNVSQPGNVASNMPFVSATIGRAGEQYVSLRVANGTEAYQALGSNTQLVGFHSESVLLTWRRWFGPGWGLTAQGEAYRNSVYRRQTVGAGVFVQW